MTANGSLRHLQHEHHKVPVTALDFYGDDVLLAGEGTRLAVYSVQDRNRLCSFQVFRDQTIHGILTDLRTGVILVYGGRHVATAYLVQAGAAQPTLAVSFTTDISDWILDATFRPTLTEDGLITATLITAHNALVECTFPTNGENASLQATPKSTTLAPGSNCILYTAHISWLSASHCLIASGTAFGDVILWSLFLSADASAPTRTQTHFTFSAHDGSVFGVHVSPLLGEDVLGGCTRALATCSDDRTVRVWDISDLHKESPGLLDIQRDTGFGAKQEADALAPPLLAKAMGHISRIWHVRFVRSAAVVEEHFKPGDKALKLLSFGEDATRITWDLVPCASTVDTSGYALQQAHVESLHSGKSIWAVASTEQQCATGAADGSIALLAPLSKKPIAHEIPADILSRNGLNKSAKDAIKSYDFISATSAIATTTQGSVILLSFAANGGTTLQMLGEFESLRSYSMVSGLAGYAYIAGAGGFVYMYSQESRSIAEVTKLNGKAAGLFIADGLFRDDVNAQSTQTLLVTTVGAGIAKLHQTNIVFDQGASTGTDGLSWQLQFQSGFIATSFTTLLIDDHRIAVVGSRTGQLALYTMDTIDRTDTERVVMPLQIMSGVHAKDAVTCLRAQSGTNGTAYICSTGRDGTYAIHRASISAGSLDFTLVHQVELPFGPNIEGLAITPDQHLRAWGFRSKHFVAHDVTTQRDIITVECGGAHRNWAYHPTEEGGTFIWTKASQVMWTSQSDLPFRTINSGGHGREIKAVAVSGGKKQLIATGAEDTDIKHFTYDAQAGFRCMQTLRKHNTGIQHLQWSEDGLYLFSSGGFEEFYIWRICHDVPYIGVGVVCESKHPSSGTSDLRIMGFNVHEHTINERSFEVCMAYSDSSLKTWRYEAGTWEMLASGDYLTACLTNAISMDTEKDGSKQARLLTTATDGHLALWEQTRETLVWQERRKIHQNAILDIVDQPLADGSRLVFTAGDDNGIGVTHIGAEGITSVLLIPRAHAAAVTALVVKRVAESTFWLVSASIDQRFKLWEVEAVEGITVRKMHSAFTSVADISSASLIRLQDEGTGVLICGVGMDVWRLPG